MELDLAERQDGLAPEIERLNLVESELIKIEKENANLNGLLAEANEKIIAQESILSLEERNRLLDENIELGNTIEEQTEIIGEKGIVTKEVVANDRSGKVKINMEEFRATSDQNISVGAKVKVTDAEGITVTVMPLEGEE